MPPPLVGGLLTSNLQARLNHPLRIPPPLVGGSLTSNLQSTNTVTPKSTILTNLQNASYSPARSLTTYFTSPIFSYSRPRQSCSQGSLVSQPPRSPCSHHNDLSSSSYR